MGFNRITVFIDRPTLESLVLGFNKYPNLFAIIKKFAALWTDLSEEDLINLENDTEHYLNRFIFNNGIELKPHKECFKAFYENPELILNYPRSIFLLDINPDKAAELTRQFGLIVQSNNNLNDEVLQLNYPEEFVKGEIIAGPEKGWLNIFKENSITLPPSNALVIADSWLFENTNKNRFGKLVNIGLENLKDLLNVLLPEHCSVCFHIFVLVAQTLKYTPKDIFEKLSIHINQLRDYKISLEMVFACKENTPHKRRIYSNYYFLNCDKGFKLFYIDLKTIYDENDMLINSVLHSPASMSGKGYYLASSKRLNEIRGYYDKTCEQVSGGITTVNIFNNESYESNRLLQSIKDEEVLDNK